MGRGLSAILPRSRADEPGLREIPLELIAPNPRQPRRDFDEEALAGAGGVDPLARGAPADRGPPARRRHASSWSPASAGCAPRGWPSSSASPRWCARPRTRAARPGAGREHGPRRPEPGRGGARLRDARRGPRPDQGGGRPPRRQEPRRRLEPDPAARAARRGARADRGRRPHRGPRPRDPDREGPRRAASAWPATPATTAGRCARPSAAPAARPSAASRAREPSSIHPDQADALAAAEDALTAALGYEVKVRARGDGARAELVFDSPGEAIELAERCCAAAPAAAEPRAAEPRLAGEEACSHTTDDAAMRRRMGDPGLEPGTSSLSETRSNRLS